MVFMVYNMEGDFAISWCTPWKEILDFCGIHHGRVFCIFMVYTIEEGFDFCGVHYGS